MNPQVALGVGGVVGFAAVIALAVRKPRGWLPISLLLLLAIGVAFAIVAPGVGVRRR